MATNVAKWVLISIVMFALTLMFWSIRQAGPAPGLPPLTATGGPLGTRPGDPQGGPPAGAAPLAHLGTSDTALPLALGFGATPGELQVATMGTSASAVWLTDGVVYRFPMDFAPGTSALVASAASRTEQIVDPVLGRSERISAAYHSTDGMLDVTLHVTASHTTAALIYQVEALSRAEAVAWFSLLDPTRSQLDLSGPVQYLTLRSSDFLSGSIADGSAMLPISLSPGAPLVLWSDDAAQGYIVGLLDRGQGAAAVMLEKRAAAQLHVGIEAGPQSGSAMSPRLYLEQTRQGALGPRLAGYRAALDTVAPPPPIPRNFRQQWGTWYVLGGGITEDLLRDHVDTLAAQYGDLGPWQVVIDAGWYRAGADPDGEVGLVDTEKFPSGMRALIDHMHARGLSVILYGPAPWVDSRPSTASWWVVQLGFLRDHLAWLIPVSEDDEGATYVYDLSNPELRVYLADLVRRYLVEFDADGIEMDMVGIIGPSGGPFRGEPFAPEDTNRQRGLAQTLEVYRSVFEAARSAKPGAWIESGYAAPPLARQYVHSWRVADDYPAFTHPYPFVGLLEQITFTALRHQLLGARPNLGFIWGDPDLLPIQQQWLAAAVALQAQTNVSVDLTAASDDATSTFREYLAALRPFSATPWFGPGSPPAYFGTTVGETSYVAFLNPDDRAQTFQIDREEFGLVGASGIVFDPATRTAFALQTSVAATVTAASLRLLVVRSQAGVLWGSRSWSSRRDDDALVIHIDPSGSFAGQVWLYLPGATGLTLNGTLRPLAPQPGVQRVDLPDASAHTIRVTFAP